MAGYVQGKNIGVNIDSSKALNTVVGHEITHILEGTELYPALQDVVKVYAEAKGEYNSKLQSITKMYDGIEDANIENELTAELVGEYIFSDTDFIKNLSVEQPGLFQKIYDEVKYLCKVVTTRSKEARQLEKVKKAFEDAYKQKNNTVTDNGVKYSLNANFQSEYDSWDKIDPTIHFDIGTTSEALKQIGLSDKKIVWDSSKIIKIKSKHPEMNDIIIKQVPEILENPIIVMQSKNSSSRLTMFGEVYTAENKPVLAVLELNPTKNNIAIDEIKLASAYGKDNAQNFINSSKVLYVDKNKKRTEKWSQITRLQLPVNYELSSSNNSISNSAKNVKENDIKFSLVDGSTDIAPEMNNNIYGEDIKLQQSDNDLVIDDDVPIKQMPSAETTNSQNKPDIDIPDLFYANSNQIFSSSSSCSSFVFISSRIFDNFS